MGSGTGAHIARDLRPRGPISLGIWGRGGGEPKSMGGLYHYYTGTRPRLTVTGKREKEMVVTGC